MKRKNVLFGSLALSLSIAHARIPQDEPATIQHVAQVAAEVLKQPVNVELGSRNPAVFAFKNLYAYMHSLRSPGLELQSRAPRSSRSKTAQFNESLLKFIKEVYNEQTYPTFLSQDAAHLAQFFDLANELSLNRQTVSVCLRLFYNKLKECEFVLDSVLPQILPPLASLEKYFDLETIEHKDDLTLIKHHIEQTLLSRFTENFARFQQEPGEFMSSLSQKLADDYALQLHSYFSLVSRQTDDLEAINRLRSTTIRLVELVLGKIMWNVERPEEIWSSFKATAIDLQNLGLHKVLTEMDDLDDMLWSLVHRFCYFLDLCGAMLPDSFFAEVERDLASKSVYFLEAAEQDDGIKTKKQYLIEFLLKAQMKSVAFQRGIVA